MLKNLQKNKLLVFLILHCFYTYSQNEYDIKLLENKTIYKNIYESKREVSYMFKDKKWFVKYNPISLFFGGALIVYQKYISFQIGAACPYEVNCSNFAKRCIQQYGLLYGVPLTADRLTRCTRLASFDLIKGVDFNSKTNKIYDSPDEYTFWKKK